MSIRTIKTNRGFTLLEAILGFLILSIGMLGIASLQTVSLKAGKTSVYTAVALMKVEELFESMRANSSVAALSTYDSDGEGSGSDNGCTGTTTCTDIALAQEDIYWWKKNLQAGLPSTATTIVAVTAAVPPSKMAVVRIDITWNERDKNSKTSKSKTYTTTTNICTEIPC